MGQSKTFRLYLIQCSGKNFFKNKIDYNSNPTSLEAQLASISDDIAYNSHDLEDGSKSKII